MICFCILLVIIYWSFGLGTGRYEPVLFLQGAYINVGVLFTSIAWIYVYNVGKASFDSFTKKLLIIVIIGNWLGVLTAWGLIFGGISRIFRVTYAFFQLNANTLGVWYLGEHERYT
eukprot:410663_1